MLSTGGRFWARRRPVREWSCELLLRPKMRAICLLLPFDILSLQFLLCLSGAEQIGGQFSASHMIQNLLMFLQTLSAPLPIPTISVIFNEMVINALACVRKQRMDSFWQDEEVFSRFPEVKETNHR